MNKDVRMDLAPTQLHSRSEDEIDLSAIYEALSARRWMIALMVVIGLLGAAAFAVLSRPSYSSNVLIQVEEKSASPIQDMEALSQLFGAGTPTETEIQIIRSRAVIGEAVDRLRLTIHAAPNYLPVFGYPVARFNESGAEGLAKAPFGLDKFAWGGEEIVLRRLEVPANWYDEQLSLIAGEDGDFTLFGPDGDQILEGRIGQAAESPALGVSVFVAQLVARPGTEFNLVRFSRPDVIEDLNERLGVAEQGRDTGIIQLSLDDHRPDQIVKILDEIAGIYLYQNVQRLSEKAGKTLDFLNEQLPTLNAQAEAAEQALNAHRSKSGSVDLGLEVEAALKRLTEIEQQLSALELQRMELRERFAEKHPTMVALNRKQQVLRKNREEFESVIKGLPEVEQNTARLMRNAEVTRQLYIFLLNKAQEFKILKAGTVGNVRVIDWAMLPEKPVAPKKALIIPGGAAGGLFLGVLLALLSRALRKTVNNPDEYEQQLGLPIYATICETRKETKLQRRKEAGLRVLAGVEPTDLAVEAVRSLRTSLQFATMDAPNNRVCITGPAPGIGKTFVSANLAWSLAELGKSVALVDCDLRRGFVGKRFDIEDGPGLSDYISGQAGLDDILRTFQDGRLCVIAAGSVPPNPAELLSAERFLALIDELSQRFDTVLLDTPPVLGLADANIVARLAGTTLLVLRLGEHPIGMAQKAVRQLELNGVRLRGLVVNGVEARSGGYGYGYGYYQYGYYAKKQ